MKVQLKPFLESADFAMDPIGGLQDDAVYVGRKEIPDGGGFVFEFHDFFLSQGGVV